MQSMPREDQISVSPGTYNENTLLAIGEIEIKNSYYNHYGIWTRYQKKAAADMPKREPGSMGPAIVIGSGSTLDQALPRLKDWEGAIFCSSSHLSTLIYHGCEPDYLLLLDPRCALAEMPIDRPYNKIKTKLILHPGVPTEFVYSYPNFQYYYRPMYPYHPLYWTMLPTGYDFIGAYMWLFACHNAMVMAAARMMGYDPIIMMGMDGAQIKTRGRPRYRFTKWSYEANKKTKKKKWVKTQPSVIPVQQRIMSDSGAISDAVQLYYKKSVMQVYWLDEPNLLNASIPGGIWTEFPEISVDDVFARQKTGYKDLYQPLQERQDVAERYMIHRRSFIVPIEPEEGEAGVRFVEAPGGKPWRVELEGFIRRELDPFNIKLTGGKEAVFARWEKLIGEIGILWEDPEKIHYAIENMPFYQKRRLTNAERQGPKK